MAVLGEFLASLAWSFLRYYLERQSVRNDERRKIALEGLEKINEALDWKISHPIAPSDDPFGDFVRADKESVPNLPGDDPGKAGPK